MADLPINESGADPVFTAADPLGDTFKNDGETLLLVVGPVDGYTVNVVTSRDCEYGPHPDLVLTSEIGSTGMTSEHFSTRRFNDKTGRVNITYDDPVGISVAALRVGTHK